MCIRDRFRDGGTVKVSRSLKELGMRVQAAREYTMKLCGAEPTLQQLAEQLGVSRQAVSKWESGQSDPSTTNLLALAKLFGVRPEELLQEAE